MRKKLRSEFQHVKFSNLTRKQKRTMDYSNAVRWFDANFPRLREKGIHEHQIGQGLQDTPSR